MTDHTLELIVIISNQGFKDEIMETAKLNGARGGTVLHGRSTANSETIKFFGIKVQPEKEVILIVTKKEKKSAIMKAVADNHGVNTEARSLCFSLPVLDSVGFKF